MIRNLTSENGSKVPIPQVVGRRAHELPTLSRQRFSAVNILWTNVSPKLSSSMNDPYCGRSVIQIDDAEKLSCLCGLPYPMCVRIKE